MEASRAGAGAAAGLGAGGGSGGCSRVTVGIRWNGSNHPTVLVKRRKENPNLEQARLVELLNGIQEVRGSNPLGSSSLRPSAISAAFRHRNAQLTGVAPGVISD